MAIGTEGLHATAVRLRNVIIPSVDQSIIGRPPEVCCNNEALCSIAYHGLPTSRATIPPPESESTIAESDTKPLPHVRKQV
jgi:hypothetical protein